MYEVSSSEYLSNFLLLLVYWLPEDHTQLLVCLLEIHRLLQRKYLLLADEYLFFIKKNLNLSFQYEAKVYYGLMEIACKLDIRLGFILYFMTLFCFSKSFIILNHFRLQRYKQVVSEYRLTESFFMMIFDLLLKFECDTMQLLLFLIYHYNQFHLMIHRYQGHHHREYDDFE